MPAGRGECDETDRFARMKFPKLGQYLCGSQRRMAAKIHFTNWCKPSQVKSFLHRKSKCGFCLVHFHGNLLHPFIIGLFFMPLMLTVALLVMRDGGPCVFGHARVGMGGRKFRCLKFRSMVMNADQVLKDTLAKENLAAEAPASQLSYKNGNDQPTKSSRSAGAR